ncbi:MAG: NfeD family protein [Clostridia bacterium]|nr:NfeD family protein [Clostridia bacterium]
MIPIWVTLIILLILIEALTPQLLTIWFAAGSAVGLILALLKLPEWLQIGAAVAVSLALLVATRPLVRKLNRTAERTNAMSVIGKTAVVTDRIDNIAGTGRVSVAGQSWSARSADNEPLREGDTVQVLHIEGVKVIVTKVN